MKRLALMGLGLLLAVAQPALAALPTADSQGNALPSLAPMLKKTIPAVVNIYTTARVPVRQNPLFNDPFFRYFFDAPQQPRERVTSSLGSGVVLDAAKGLVVTNNHVIANADEIQVKLNDGRSLKGELVGTDPEADIAVVRVDHDKLVGIPFADSDRIEVGDFVVAIGNPYGLGQTVTSGIVSALGRSGLGIEGYEDFIQTDASINPGNSGGALVNLNGELVGINTAILSQGGGNVGIGFSIPINMVRAIVTQLVEHGDVQRGALGAQAQDLDPELAAAFDLTQRKGAVVTQVNPGSPADRAGLKVGDIITDINGVAIDSSSDVRNRIGLLRVGESVELKVLRGGKSKRIKARIEAPQEEKVAGGKIHPKLDGALLANIVEGSPLYGKIEGVQVVELDRRGAAAYAGLRPGDVILQANRRPVKDLAALRDAVSGSDALLLNIQRQDSALFLVIR